MCAAQGWCVCRDGGCAGSHRTLSDEQYLQVAGRAATDGDTQIQDTRSICQLHHDRWLHRYKPTKCAACPQPLSACGSMQCPEWMREQLNAHHGAFVHKRPCYEKALAAKKQPAANTLPAEVEQENEQPQQTFQIDVSQHKRNTSNTFDASTHTHKYVLCLLVCADRRIWRRTLGTICIRRLRISAD